LQARAKALQLNGCWPIGRKRPTDRAFHVPLASALLRPLVEAIRQHVCAGPVLHADDTTVPVLAPGLGRTRTGRLWATRPGGWR
jgi:hypothetical protein